MKRLIPFIAAVAVILSALQLDIFAADTYSVKYATRVYGSTGVNSSGFLIDFERTTAIHSSNTVITSGSHQYIVNRYVVSGLTGSTSNMIILNNDDDNSAHVMGITRHVGDTDLWFFCRWQWSNGFGVGFNDYNLDVDPTSFSAGSLDRSIAEMYVAAQANNNVVPIDRIVPVISGTTQFDASAVSSGKFGEVYQGVVTSSGKLISSGVTQYYYNANNMTIMWQLNTTWKDISVDNNFWMLYKLNRNVSYIPRSNGITAPGFSIGYQNSNDIDYYSITLTGLYYYDDSYSLNAFITDLLFMLFDVDGENAVEFESKRYIWCVPATINQDQQQDIIDQQDVIVDKLGDIYDAIVGGDETAPSSPSEEQLINMIDKTALENARSQINAFDVSAYAAAVSAILYINTAWANYPVFASAIILVGVGFLIFTIINGLKKK